MRFTQSILFGSPCKRAQAIRALGYRKSVERRAADLGTAFHLAIERDTDEPIRWLTEERDVAVGLACFKAFKNQFIMPDDCNKEVMFEIPVPFHEPHTIAGVIDLLSYDTLMLGPDVMRKMAIITDIKTFSTWRLPSSLDTWALLSSQLATYAWAVWKLTGLSCSRAIVAVVKPQHRLRAGETPDEFAERAWREVRVECGNARPMTREELGSFESELIERVARVLSAIDNGNALAGFKPLLVNGELSACYGTYECDFVDVCAEIAQLGSGLFPKCASASPELEREFTNVL